MGTTTTTTGPESDQERGAKSEAAAKQPLEFTEFLRAVPPNSKTEVSKLHKFSGGNTWYLTLDDVILYCSSGGCERPQNFANTDGNVSIGEQSQLTFLTYQCRNCRKSMKTYALLLARGQNGTGSAIKFGEIPTFGSNTPARLITLIGADRDLFLKGRRAENLGLGVGAFAYYRRVVENQKDRIITEVRKVAVKVGVGEPSLRALDRAIKETRFSESINLAKDGLPQGLMIGGFNPLTLLHDALSKGLHVYDDQICLELAKDIRLVLGELAERMTQLLRDDAELTEAINRLRKPVKQ